MGNPFGSILDELYGNKGIHPLKAAEDLARVKRESVHRGFAMAVKSAAKLAADSGQRDLSDRIAKLHLVKK